MTGLALTCTLPGVRIGDLVTVQRPEGALPCEVVGFRDGEAVAMPLGPLTGVGPQDVVVSSGARLSVPVAASLLGRIVDGLGRPLDSGGPITPERDVPVDADPLSPLHRKRIDRPLVTGVRAIDLLTTLGEGQRVGLFAGSGVGKSTLLAQLARGAEADVVVVALVGERGREVREFVEDTLGDEGRRKSVVVCATSDVSALERLRAAHVATAYAEHFADQGARVLLLVDSVTRFARAQREVGLAAGEPPARRGYPPSVFAALPRLLERSGPRTVGTITAVYTVLVEGGDMDEPIADEVRGILDGHVVLERQIAARGRFPAIDVTVSLSRLMSSVTDTSHRALADRCRRLVALYEDKRDLITIGAYTPGTDPELDHAVRAMPKIESVLSQRVGEATGLDGALEALAQAMGDA